MPRLIQILLLFALFTTGSSAQAKAAPPAAAKPAPVPHAQPAPSKAPPPLEPAPVPTAPSAEPAPRQVDAPSQLTLAEAFALALPRSEEYRLSQRDVKDAEARQAGVWSQIGPQVGASITGLLQNEIIIFTRLNFARPQQLQLSGSINQPLFRRGIFESRKAFRNEVDYYKTTTARVRSQVMMDVVSSFLDVIQARQRIQLAQGTLVRARGQLNDARARFKAGGGLQSAEMLASVEVSRAELGLSSARSEERNKAITFERVIGVPPPETLVLPERPQPASLSEALETAAANRSDLLAQQARIPWAERMVQVQKARFWPTLDIQAGFTYFYPPGLLDFGWYARGLLSIPIFQTGDELVQLKLQKLRLEQVKLQRDQIKKQVTDEVKRAVNRIITAKEAAAIADQQVVSAQQAYTLISQQFRLGGAQFLDVINAQGLLSEAEILQLVARSEIDLAIYSLLFAEGTLKL